MSPSIVPIDTTLNTFIRSHARLTGTKFMCLEGGCGVCIVNLTGLKTANGETRSIAVNSVKIILVFSEENTFSWLIEMSKIPEKNVYFSACGWFMLVMD